VATAENAAQVLAAEGVGTAYNIAMFLTLSQNRKLLMAGDLLVVDEASMVTTGQLTALHQLAAEAGAKLLLTGDPAQLPAIGAGGALAMIARQHGCYQLTVVQRMTQAWEREASLRLRDGDLGVLADYDRHGRLLDGTATEMETAAYRAWLADYLDGQDTLLIAATKEQAAALSSRARADLIALGLVRPGGVNLADGNTAGVGDLVQARHNDRRIRDAGGRPVANRDVWKIERIERGSVPARTAVIVRRDLASDPVSGQRRWGGPMRVSAKYLNEHVERIATTQLRIGTSAQRGLALAETLYSLNPGAIVLRCSSSAANTSGKVQATMVSVSTGSRSCVPSMPIPPSCGCANPLRPTAATGISRTRPGRSALLNWRKGWSFSSVARMLLSSFSGWSVCLANRSNLVRTRWAVLFLSASMRWVSWYSQVRYD
jgi:hypothetical protein